MGMFEMAVFTAQRGGRGGCLPIYLHLEMVFLAEVPEDVKAAHEDHLNEEQR